MKISDLPLKQCIVGEAFWRSRPRGGRRGPKASHLNTADLVCMHFIGELPGPHTNQYTWLWLPWIQGPSFCVFLHHAGEISGSGDGSIQRCPVKYCVAAPSRSCEALRLSNRRFADPDPPLLIWAGGNNVHWPISINPSRCHPPPPPFFFVPARISGTPPPTTSPIFFFGRQGPFFCY